MSDAQNLTGTTSEAGPGHASKLLAYRSVLEDRAAVLPGRGFRVALVADGAGGISHGDRAAAKLVSDVEAFLARDPDPGREKTWTSFLAGCDLALYHEPDCGQTTAVIVAVTPSLLCGASVGDSEAWVLAGEGLVKLTAGQRRKPFLGSGCSTPTAFRVPRRGGMLLAASDGLFKYADASRICHAVAGRTPGDACEALAALVRLPSGQLWDDLGIVVLDLSTSHG